MCRDEKGVRPPTPILQGHWSCPGFSTGLASALRCGAEQGGDLTSKPRFSGWAREGFLHHLCLVHKRGAAMGWHCCLLPTFVFNFDTFLGAHWEEDRMAD